MTMQPQNILASQQVDALEEEMIHTLNYRIAKSNLYTLGEADPSRPGYQTDLVPSKDAARVLQSDDPRLRKMPEKPTLQDFFKYRFGPANHLLQSARHAREAGCDDETI